MLATQQEAVFGRAGAEGGGEAAQSNKLKCLWLQFHQHSRRRPDLDSLWASSWKQTTHTHHQERSIRKWFKIIHAKMNIKED